MLERKKKLNKNIFFWTHTRHTIYNAVQAHNIIYKCINMYMRLDTNSERKHIRMKKTHIRITHIHTIYATQHACIQTDYRSRHARLLSVVIIHNKKSIMRVCVCIFVYEMKIIVINERRSVVSPTVFIFFIIIIITL